MRFCAFFATISSLLLAITPLEPPGNVTDLETCKVSHLGLEYSGSVGKTESGVRCQSWSSESPHKVDAGLTDDLFPDGSRRRAKNYCRNPSGQAGGPWCYTTNADLKLETCAIPLCAFTQCRLTGPGMEYAGTHKKSMADANCLKWNKKRDRVKEAGGERSYGKFDKTKFPELSLSEAGKRCRNPDGDRGGPWCFVQNEDTDEIERQYCDVPFCDEPNCEVFARDPPRHAHFTDFNTSLTNLTFGLKLWDSDSFPNAGAKLTLASVPLPMTGQEMADLGVGIEIYITNTRSALTFGNRDREPDYEDTRGILKSTAYTWFELTWTAPFISLGVRGEKKPIFLAEYKTKANLLGFAKNRFVWHAVLTFDAYFSKAKFDKPTYMSL